MTAQISLTQRLGESALVFTKVFTDFCHSNLYGKSGQYMVGSIPVEFEEQAPFVDGFVNTLKNIGNVMTLRFSYVFAHEMGHAIANKFLTGESTAVIISSAESGLCRGAKNCTDRDEKIVLAAGPIAGALFAASQFFRAASYFSISRRIAAFLATGAFVQMVADYEYLIRSGLSKDDGDWGKLRKKGLKSLFLTASAMTAIYALGLYLAFKRLSAK